MNQTFRKIIASTVLMGSVLVGAAIQPASAAEMASLSGATRSCSNGVHSVGVAYALDGYSSGGSIIVTGNLAAPCTDGQMAVIWYRQVAMGGARGAWRMTRTGAARVHFTRQMVRMSAWVTDVEVVVCRTGADEACGATRYLHVL